MVMPMVLEKAMPDALIGIIVILVLSVHVNLSSLVLIEFRYLWTCKRNAVPEHEKENDAPHEPCGLFVICLFMVAVTPN